MFFSVLYTDGRGDVKFLSEVYERQNMYDLAAQSKFFLHRALFRPDFKSRAIKFFY